MLSGFWLLRVGVWVNLLKRKIFRKIFFLDIFDLIWCIFHLILVGILSILILSIKNGGGGKGGGVLLNGQNLLNVTKNICWQSLSLSDLTSHFDDFLRWYEILNSELTVSKNCNHLLTERIVQLERNAISNAHSISLPWITGDKSCSCVYAPFWRSQPHLAGFELSFQ